MCRNILKVYLNIKRRLKKPNKYLLCECVCVWLVFFKTHIFNKHFLYYKNAYDKKTKTLKTFNYIFFALQSYHSKRG